MKLFLDGPSLDELEQYNEDDSVDGFTTNPTLLRQSGVTDYLAFAKMAVTLTSKPISLEVIADNPSEMEHQARRLAELARSVYVKIPITTTSGYFLGDLIWRLSQDGIKTNVTAVFTEEQVLSLFDDQVASSAMPRIVSIFAGRISDTGVSPLGVISYSLQTTRGSEILWASPRCIWDYYQALDAGCDIITIPPPMLDKFSLKGKDLAEYSLETVQMFYSDAQDAGLTL